MSILNNIVTELDIALRTLSDKKNGTDRQYPPDPKEKNKEELSKKEKDLSSPTHVRIYPANKFFFRFGKFLLI